VIEENRDVKDETERTMIATAVLVKPPARSSGANSSDAGSGRLLLFDPSGKNVVEVASGVREIHLINVSAGELTILYERNRRFVLAAFDSGSLAKRREQEIDIPLLK
jgi:hypothetical protein